jgi:16S rRNA G527 N7-methylase RsmG
MLQPLEAYFELLTHWNARINLTALPLDPPTDETFDRLLVEPLAAAKQIPTNTRRFLSRLPVPR